MQDNDQEAFEAQQRADEAMDTAVDMEASLMHLLGESADFEQRLRTLVDALADEELFHESTQVAYAEAQKLLAEARQPTTLKG